MLAAASGALCVCALQSCFTGIEGTGKINLSKKDIIATAPTEEDKFLSPLASPPLKDWEKGRAFLVADEKIRLVTTTADSGGLNVNDTLRYEGVESGFGAGGGESTMVKLTASNGSPVYYTIEKPVDTALATFTTVEIPMLIDLSLTDSARRLLKGKKVWSRTALWYDDSMQYKKGRKFIPLMIEDVQPGNSFFPLMIKFKSEDGDTGNLYMNLGSSGTDSRSFAKLFSLADPKNNYKHITREHWEAISREEVMAGMTKEECRLALGNPSDVAQGHDYSNAMEIWYYPDGRFLRFVDGLLVK